MKIIKSILSCIVTLGTMYSCQNPFEPDDGKLNTEYNEYPPNYTIVFCDFTSSLDSAESVKKIISDAGIILKKYAKKETITYYTISKDNNTPQLYKSKPLVLTYNSNEEDEFDDSLGIRVIELTKKLTAAASLKEFAKKNEPNSCIISHIEKAITDFKGIDGCDTIPLKLYILSDMLECCTFSRANVEVCIEPFHNIEDMEKNAKSVTDKTLSFKRFKNLEIKILLSANKYKESSDKVFRNFWYQVFESYGYDWKSKRLFVPEIN